MPCFPVLLSLSHDAKKEKLTLSSGCLFIRKPRACLKQLSLVQMAPCMPQAVMLGCLYGAAVL